MGSEMCIRDRIAGFEFDKVVGKTLKVAVTRNQQLKWSDFEN